jgi:transposase
MREIRAFGLMSGDGKRSTATAPVSRLYGFSDASAKILVDTLGLLLSVDVHAANIQDRDGAEILLRQARRRSSFIERTIGDGSYQGPMMGAQVTRTGAWRLEIERRTDRRRFAVLPRQWIVERTLARISRNRRLSPDYERQTRKAAAFVRLAMIPIMLRCLPTNTSS